MHVQKMKKLKKNLNFEINEHQCLNTPKLNFIYKENLILFKFGEFFSSLNGGIFVVKLVAAKVIGQHTFSLHYIFS